MTNRHDLISKILNKTSKSTDLNKQSIVIVESAKDIEEKRSKKKYNIEGIDMQSIKRISEEYDNTNKLTIATNKPTIIETE